MKILVTRPEPDGSRLGERLEAAGHEPVLEPLMSVGYLEGEGDLAADFKQAQAIAFTSANGVRALMRSIGARVFEGRDLPVFAVGAATAAAAKREGFTRVHEAGGDVSHLAARIGTMLEPEDGPILHIAGSVVAGDLAGSLASFGFHIERRVLYDTSAAQALRPEVISAITDGSLGGVVVYSPRTGRILVNLVGEAGLAAKMAALTCYCLSDNVADAVAPLPFGECLVAQTPDEDALLDLLHED
jgi:uroporphyrinogen-III synthase